MNLFIYTLCAFGAVSSLAAQGNPEISPVIKPADEFAWPPKFRSSDLQSLASGQFSKKGFDKVCQEYGSKNLVVIDLRREFHGFVDGYPISWKLTDGSSYDYNENLSVEEIEGGERELLGQLDGFQIVQSEREFVEQSGAQYIRFPVIDHSFPQGEEVDDFIHLISSFGNDSLIYFHCAGGSGRTTTFLSMLDMLQNKDGLSCMQILERQEAIGGSNLYNPESTYSEEPERIEGAIERLQFLVLFHQYCAENPDHQISWSSWIKGQPK